jgi:hypothetical protein
MQSFRHHRPSFDFDAGDQRVSPAMSVLRGHCTWVNAVAVAKSAGRVHVLSASNDDSIRLWDAATAEQLIVLASPISSIRTLAATTTDRGLALAGAGVNGAVCWWNLSLPELTTRVMTGHTGSVATARIGRLDGGRIVITGASDQTVRAWDPTAPSERAAAAAAGQRHDAVLACLALALVDGEQIVASGDENGTQQPGAARLRRADRRRSWRRRWPRRSTPARGLRRPHDGTRSGGRRSPASGSRGCSFDLACAAGLRSSGLVVPGHRMIPVLVNGVL